MFFSKLCRQLAIVTATSCLICSNTFAAKASELDPKSMLKRSINGIECTTYLEKEEQKLEAAWNRSGSPDRPAVFSMTLSKNGEIEDVKLEESSGSTSFDNKAKLAVETVKQFDPLPSAVTGNRGYLSAIFDDKTKDVYLGYIEVDFGPYMAYMHRRIKAGWFPPRDFESKRIIAQFKVGRDGQISDIKVTQSSGQDNADKVAIEAVRAASPLRPLPRFSPSSLDLQFTFDYNVSNKPSTKTGDTNAPSQDTSKGSAANQEEENEDDQFQAPSAAQNSTGQVGNIAAVRTTIMQLISKQWQPVANFENIVLLLNLDKQGNLTNSQILKSCGNKRADDGALEAVKKTSFPWLPDWYKGSELTFQIDMAKVAALKKAK